MAALAAPLMIAGTLFQGVSALGQGLYQSQVAKNNAVVATRNANVAATQAQTSAMRSDREYAAQRGQVIATQAASGTTVGDGSNGAVLGLIDRNRQEAAGDIRQAGTAQSSDFMNKAAFYRGEAGAARSAGITSMIGSVLKAGGQAYGAYGPDNGGSALGPSRRAYPWPQ